MQFYSKVHGKFNSNGVNQIYASTQHEKSEKKNNTSCQFPYTQVVLHRRNKFSMC